MAKKKVVAKKAVAKKPVAKKAAKKAAAKKKSTPATAKAKAKAKTKAKASAKAKPKASKPAKKPSPQKATTPAPSPEVARERRDDLATRAAATRPVIEELGTITVPSGKLAIFDIGLVGYMPRDTLEPAIVTCDVPRDRPLSVTGTRVARGRFADCWEHVTIDLGQGDIYNTRKLGEAGVDFARLVCMDHAALDHWQHDESLDGLADVVFWGRDEAQLAKALKAPRTKEGYGWIDLPVADAEAKVFEAEILKADNKWLLNIDFRPHSHHFQALAAARASSSGAGTLSLAGTQMMLFFTSWGDGVFPVYLDLDHDDKPVRVRIQLATEESNAAMRAVN
ncbi:MAG: hypothetical protein AB7T06_02575 [Kofleriaceae bacterium]